ncbi:MAG TPA: ribose 5-phosphate isomerase B [Desulfonatronum sp.]|nr:ribose 5-phosphate isomerase B [Desulfonatronum sp.]
MNATNLLIASDHAGFDLKENIKSYLDQIGRTVEDLGTHTLDSCDYPLKAQELCHKVLQTDCPGILICGTGQGMAMSANRIPGIRAALCVNEFMARAARAHNKANVLCLGSRVLGTELARSIVLAFLTTDFEGQRHQRRIDQMETLKP